MIKEVIFLGAGASSADGAPTQKGLLAKFCEIYQGDGFEELYFQNEITRNNLQGFYNRISLFFNSMFGINIQECNVSETQFPTFEECLGVIEIARSKSDILDLDDTGSDLLSLVRNDLVFLIAMTLKKTLPRFSNRDDEFETNHDRLVKRLHQEGRINQTAFMSTNYDILIDNALIRYLRENYRSRLNYSIPFDGWPIPTNNNPLFLFKLHGSLNWSFCPNCGNLWYFKKQKIVADMVVYSLLHMECGPHQTPSDPVVVPPTFFKEMNTPFLPKIWSAAERVIKDAERLIFCGYSFSDADLHVKYLFKKLEVNRNFSPEIYVINRSRDKETESRFRRFFKNPARLNFYKLDFENFCLSGFQELNQD